MAEVPKIVHHRLRAAMTAPEALAHPEADMLAAFAEQALSAVERDGILRHLALCADCRDVIALALPAVDVAIRPVEEEEREVVVASASEGRTSSRGTSEERKSRFSWSGFAWANLRWATLAAGIAVAVFVMRPAWQHAIAPHASLNSAANQGTKPSGAPTPASQVASVDSAADSLAAKDDKEKKDKNDGGKHETTTARDKSLSGDSRYGVEPKSGAVVDGPVVAGVINGRVDGRLDKERSDVLRRPSKTIPPPSESPMRLAGNMVALGGMKQGESGVKKDSAAATPAPGALSKSESNKPAIGAATETVAVSGGAEEVTSSQLNATLPTEEAALQNAPAIEKAKPALDEMAVNEKLSKSASKAATSSPAATSLADNSQAEVTSKAQVGTFAMGTAAPSAMTPRPATKWTITDGVLQRSLDEGHTWQAAARADHALLCYANRGQEMWAGGGAGTLLHSTDNGAIWSAVAVSFKGQSLTSAVTRIEIGTRSSAEIVITTEDDEIWSSVDSGKSWEKK